MPLFVCFRVLNIASQIARFIKSSVNSPYALRFSGQVYTLSFPVDKRHTFQTGHLQPESMQLTTVQLEAKWTVNVTASFAEILEKI